MSCRISAYSETSGSLFKHKMWYLMASKKNNPLFVRGCDRKIRLSPLQFAIILLDGFFQRTLALTVDSLFFIYQCFQDRVVHS